MARGVAVANQKGGVAKPTTVHSIGAALVERDVRVLLVDLDPQACLSYSVGLDPEALRQPHQQEIAKSYDEIFKTFELVKEWEPAETQLGPELRLYRPKLGPR